MLRPHLAWPVQFGPTGFVMVEQDSEDDIASCVGTVLSWPLGTRPSDPTFGVPDESFLQGGANLDEIRQAIVEAEPRAADLTVVQDDAQLANLVSAVSVGFTAQEAAP